ncbi:MAG: hypothetical protein U0231_12755 [Nitrospiraceae bacterium]
MYVDKLLRLLRETARPMSLLSGPTKDRALRLMAANVAEAEEAILQANEQDVEAIGKTMAGESNRERVREAVARVRMTADDVKAIVDRLNRIADLPDPLSEVIEQHDEPNGMQVARMRSPLGVIESFRRWPRSPPSTASRFA